MLTLDKIYHASYVLRDVVHETAWNPCAEDQPECDVYLKRKICRSPLRFLGARIYDLAD